MTTTSTPQLRIRTQKQVFAELHRQMRVWNPDVPAAVERLDPVLKLLLDLFSHQISKLEGDVAKIWENASRSLIRAMSPECRRWPIPATTIMRCKPVDPVVEVDTDTRFYYREPRDDGRTFLFAPARTSQLLNAELTYAFLLHDNGAVSLAGEQADPSATRALGQSQSNRRTLLLGFQYDGTARRIPDSLLYLGPDRALGALLRWSSWRCLTPDGPGERFSPGRGLTVDSLFSDEPDRVIDWGGLRTGGDLFAPLIDHFARLPQSAAEQWQAMPLPRELTNELGGAAGTAGVDPLWWFEIMLPGDAKLNQFTRPLDLSFDCLVAVNSESQTVYHHTGSKDLLEVEVGADIEEILNIDKVVDTDGREYLPQHELSDDPDQRYYAIEERNDQLILWFDFSRFIDPVPDAINVTLTTTLGDAANGVEAGEVSQLYENHPGLDEVQNVIPVFGGVPARSDAEVMTEAHQRLRGRDRAISFDDLSRWTRTFDPRIQSVACSNGVQVTPKGVRRCIDVAATVDAEDFLTPDEMQFMAERLERFLKSRSTVNTHYSVKITAR